MRWVWQGLLAATLASTVGRAATVESTKSYTHPATKLAVVQGQLVLPGHGYWQLDSETTPAGGLKQLQLKAPAEARQFGKSQRISATQKRRLVWRGRNPFSDFMRQATKYARSNNGAMPETAEQLAGEAGNKGWAAKMLARNPYGNEVDAKPGPKYAILPGVTMLFEHPEDKTGNVSKHEPYIVELCPLYDDGKHWVLFADGKRERVAIDAALMAKHGLKVEAYLPDPDAPPPPLPESLVYSVYAVQADARPATFALVNLMTGGRETCTWNPAGAQPGTPEIAEEWATLRLRRWAAYAGTGSDAPILRHWAGILRRQYGAEAPEEESPRRRRNRDRTTDAFGVLGGRAAMRETLQMRLLQMGRKTEGTGVPVADIPGVQVKSHPFQEMLGGKPGGSLPIADVVPLDRFMLYVRRPDALLPMLGQGAAFLSRLGANATGRSLSYQLEDRYLGRLGMDRAWLEQFLKSGFVTEMALVLPDLFVVDGTEITVISRVPRLALLKPLLATVGVTDLADGRVASVKLPDGATCFWSVLGDLVIVGTNREEMSRVLGAKAGRTPSLGKSDEFGYMLRQLAPTEKTRMFAYFSDPFIRRLVGPEVKIGQLRRMQERARLEALTAAALLYRADGHAKPPTLETLVADQYLSGNLDWSGLSLDGQQHAVSRDYGQLGGLASVSSCPVLLATAEEAEAYKQYVASYTRFWRRFFDPIAVRLNDAEDGGLAVETFILPLLDNSMYNGLRQVVGGADTARGMRVPKLTPEPVLLASLNLGEGAWRDMLSDMFYRQGNRGFAAALDKLGPAVHIAVQDSDPIIAFGSGEMLGLGGTVMDSGGRGMIVIPIYLSLLTRPVTIAVEMSDPAPVRQFLETGAVRNMIPWQRQMGSEASWYRLGDSDAWVLGIDLFGIGIRFRFQLQDNYLLISNLPWEERSRVHGTEAAGMSALEIRLHPARVEQQLAAMFTAAHERQRKTALGGMGYLLPFTEMGLNVQQGVAEHRRLLGFAPTHPAPGHWLIEKGQLASSMYGRLARPRQPEYTEGKGRFGLLQGVSDLRVGLQFEDEGLRTLVRWRYNVR